MPQADIHSQQQEQQYQRVIQSNQRRLSVNLEILEILKNYFIANPTYRFGQGLYNLDIATHRMIYDKDNGPQYVDIFFKESIDLIHQLPDSESVHTYPNPVYPNTIIPRFKNDPEVTMPIDKPIVDILEYLEERNKEE